MPITYKEAIRVAQRNWRFPSMQRDLALIGGVIVVAAALVGAGIGVAVDVLVHRLRVG